MPHPVVTDVSTITARGNPPRPLERTSTTSHLVARIPKKRIGDYQKEYENATTQQTGNGDKAADNNSDSNAKEKSSDSLHSDSLNNDKNVFDDFESSPMNPYGSDFTYEIGKAVAPTPYTGNPPPSTSTHLNLLDMDNSTITTVEDKKDTDDSSLDHTQKTSSSSNNKFMDFDYIPPSPLSSARHSHLGSLAQVAQLKATSIVMPASPRTPMGGVSSRSAASRKDKSEPTKKDITPSRDSSFDKSFDSQSRSSPMQSDMVAGGSKQADNGTILGDSISDLSSHSSMHHGGNTSNDIMHNSLQHHGPASNSSSSDISSLQMPPPELPPRQMGQQGGKSCMDKDVEKVNDPLQATPSPYSPEVNYSSEPLFSPPSILPPDSVNQEHDHSPTMPTVVQGGDSTGSHHSKGNKDSTPSQATSQVYSNSSYMDTTPQGMDLSQRGMYSQDTCALQTKQTSNPQQPQQTATANHPQSMYDKFDSFSPPYGSQTSGPSPSMGSSNPGSNNQIMSPQNMNSNVVATTTSSYTSSSSSSQMASQQRGGYSSYYPMQSSGPQSQPGQTPGPPPPLMQPSYPTMDTTSTGRSDNINTSRQQNRTPGMVNSDRMTSPHPGNQPKNYSSYLSDASSTQQQTRESSQRLSHPEKESSSRSQRTMSTSQQRNRSSSQSSATRTSGGMGSDSRRTSSSHNQYYPSPHSSYSSQSSSQLTSPPLHHRGPPSDLQRASSYDISPYSAAAAYGALYGTQYNNPHLAAAANSAASSATSSHNQSLTQQQHKSNSHSSHSTQRSSGSSTPKNVSNTSSNSKQQQQQPPAAHSGSHHRQQQQSTSIQQQQQSVKSSSNRTTGSTKGSASKKSSSATKSSYDMDASAMMNPMFDARSMTPYFPFNPLHSPSSRNFHASTNPYFSEMFASNHHHHQRQSSQHKGSDNHHMNNPFMFPHTSWSQNGIGFNRSSMNHSAHSNHHTSTPTTQSSHSNSSATHLPGFNFNLFGGPTPSDMNASHSQDTGLNISPIKLPSHSQLLGQTAAGMDHNAAALQHQSFYQNRGQMTAPMLQHPINFLGHQHPGFDSRSMGAGTMGAHFGGHGPASFGMSLFPD